jgi:hypothetical protein
MLLRKKSSNIDHQHILWTTGPSNYWAFGLSGLRTIGTWNYRAFGLLGLLTIGPSDYWAFGLSDYWADTNRLFPVNQTSHITDQFQ